MDSFAPKITDAFYLAFWDERSPNHARAYFESISGAAPEFVAYLASLWSQRILLSPIPTNALSARHAAQEALQDIAQETLKSLHPHAGSLLEILMTALLADPPATLGITICGLLASYRAAIGRLEKPQLWKIHQQLENALCETPPILLLCLWRQLHEPPPASAPAVIGLEMLAQKHALEHLLYGLEMAETHETRARFIIHLEKVGDARVLPFLRYYVTLIAKEDWSLARLVYRAIRAIDHRTDLAVEGDLLRPSGAPIEDLLRAALPTEEAERLLRPPQEPPQTE